ncbi:hypothetical protein EXIGLDRAFT_659109, partial [Exidia glandulosa HHB12029]
MCTNSCIAYTGPYEALDKCTICQHPRRDAHGKPYKTFDTMPIGPQIQAMRRHPESAAAMNYLWKRVAEVNNLAAENGGEIPEYDDIPSGSAVLEAVDNNIITENDTVVMLSFDGAQLYRMKVSDCWIYIWIVVNLSPDRRYKQRYLIPGSFIPGPKKIKHADSFLYVGLHHISAVNNAGGLRVYDADAKACYLSRIIILFTLADGPGTIYLSGLVTHSGKYGCRLYCGMPGRRKPRDPHYWLAHLKPSGDYNVTGCMHDDLSPYRVRVADQEGYTAKLATVGRAKNQTNYEALRLETGICKPTIFDGLAPGTTLRAPLMTTEDLMHETMNIASALVDLFRGTFPCSSPDSVNTWPWAIFLNPAVWAVHGAHVASCTQFIPGIFGRCPRNPAEKINSGYKAWEWLLYVFSLGPGLFVGLLEPALFRLYCKLVKAFRILYQKRVMRSDVLAAHELLAQFVDGYERQFYQRRVERLHFVRPSIHNLSHLPMEVTRVGPLPGVAQWTLERFIGLAMDELKQHKHPYAHLSRRGLERAQLNAIEIMVPGLNLNTKTEGKLPRGHEVIDKGYVLLRACDTCQRGVTPAEAEAITAYLESQDIYEDWTPKVARWSRLLLPNGQIARSAWKECLKRPEQLRRARDVKLLLNNVTEYGEIRYYFQLSFGEPEVTKTLAMVALCTRPDDSLLEASEGVLWSVKHQGDAGLRVVEYDSIESVVAIVPHSPLSGDDFVDRFFIAEFPGLDVARYVGALD